MNNFWISIEGTWVLQIMYGLSNVAVGFCDTEDEQEQVLLPLPSLCRGDTSVTILLTFTIPEGRDPLAKLALHSLCLDQKGVELFKTFN